MQMSNKKIAKTIKKIVNINLLMWTTGTEFIFTEMVLSQIYKIYEPEKMEISTILWKREFINSRCHEDCFTQFYLYKN